MRVPGKAQVVLHRPASPVLEDQVASSKRRAGALMAGFVLAVVVVLSALGALLGAGMLSVLLAMAVASALAAGAYVKGGARVLATTRAQPADPVAHARLHNLVEGLCIAAGLPKPGVYVIEEGAANAFSAGRGPRDGSVVVTTGLLQSLNRIELEGVVAHELSHVKNHDILPATLAVTLIGPVARVLPAPAVANLVQRAVGSRRQTLADLSAVSYTRYPPGLIAALGKLRDADTAVGCASRANAHLWLAPPLSAVDAGAVDILPSLEERIAALQEL